MMGKLQEEQLAKQWEHIGISNDFVFCKVMQDEELLAGLVRLILPDLKFSKLIVQAQLAVEAGLDIHGVRFDIFAASNEGTVVEIEMQVVDTGNLPKRLRFYGSMADSMMLDKGVVYTHLKDSYIILICPFDTYGLGLHRYTFKNRCNENLNVEMGDGTTKIVLNAQSTANDVSAGLRAFLDYVAGRSVNDEYVKKVDTAVKKARQNKEWRREYMTLYQRDLENQEIGREEGRKQVITDMLKKGHTPQVIADFCGYPLKFVLEVQGKMQTSVAV